MLIVFAATFYVSIALLIAVAYFSIQMRRVSPEAPGWWKAVGWRIRVALDPSSLNDSARRYRKRMLVCVALYGITAACALLTALLAGPFD